MQIWLLQSSKCINPWLWGLLLWYAHLELSSKMGQSPTLVSTQIFIDFTIFYYKKWNFHFPYFFEYLKKSLINHIPQRIEVLQNLIRYLSWFKKSILIIYLWPWNTFLKFHGKWCRFSFSDFFHKVEKKSYFYFSLFYG